MQGTIIKAISGEYSVIHDGIITICKPLGVFRHQSITPKVGDQVIIEGNRIVEVLKRKNDLQRPCISNVDKILIITSLTEPDLNLNLLDRLITLTEWENIPTVLCLTKADLVNVEKFSKILEYYRHLGYPLYILPQDLDLLEREINHSICVVAGQSGVGKSSLINLLGSPTLLKTGSISQALGRGKHTTRHTELIQIGSGWIADTPGFGVLDLEMDVASLGQTFRDFFPHQCKFSQCLHLSEPGCSVKAKLQTGIILRSRYENYCLFVQEIKDKKKY